MVLITNVWFSASLSPCGAPARVVRSEPLQGLSAFAELETRLWSPKFDIYIGLDARNRILRDARAATLWVEIPPEPANQR